MVIQSNGLAECYIKTIKIALTAKLDCSHWTRNLPLIVLSINNMYMADLKCSSAELVFGQTIWLPGDLCCNSLQPGSRHSSDMILAMQKFANSCQPIDTRTISFKPVHLPDALHPCTLVFIRNDPIKANLTPRYDGPFLVLPELNTVLLTCGVTNFTQLLLTASNQHLLCLLWNNLSQFFPFMKMILLQILQAHTILDTRLMYPHVSEMIV